MSQSFDNPKTLQFVITLGTGSFGSSNANQITLKGFRAVVDIDKSGGQLMGTLRAQIYGVSQSDMNSITTLQWGPQQNIKNTVKVFAIDGAQQTLVFTGNIVNAWGNYNSMPDVFLMIQAQSVYAELTNPTAPKSFPGSIDPVTILQQLAGEMGLQFENNNVAVQPISNQYLPNTLLEQARTIAAAAGIWMYIDNDVMAICPSNQARSGVVPIVSSTTGLKGYPTFDGIGVNFEMLFNPSVKFGGSIQVQSSIKQAVGTWIVTNMALKLESEKPRGEWSMRVRGTKSGLAVVSV